MSERKDSLIIPSPFSTTKEKAIYLNEEELFSRTRQLQGGCSRNQHTQLSNAKCVCIKQEPISWIRHTCQAKYHVLTHGVFDIYLQSWGDLQFTSAITMYDSSAVSTQLKNKSDCNYHLFYRCLLAHYLMFCFAKLKDVFRIFSFSHSSKALCHKINYTLKVLSCWKFMFFLCFLITVSLS